MIVLENDDNLEILKAGEYYRVERVESSEDFYIVIFSRSADVEPNFQLPHQHPWNE